MTLETRADTIERARTLAVPTIRTILRKRRNAGRHGKARLLAELNTDLQAAVSAALGLGVSAAFLSKAIVDPDDVMVLAAVVTVESRRSKEDTPMADGRMTGDGRTI